jgi:sugar O-acyltransferase (sialic acid O-acetyltransferase NeuD family)
MEDLLIFGCGGVGRYVVQAIGDLNKNKPEWNIAGFIDEDSEFCGKTFFDRPVLGGIEWIRKNTSLAVIIAIFEPQSKKRIVSELKAIGCRKFPSLIHPSTWIADTVKIKEGCLIYPGTAINIDVSIGSFVTINMNCAIGHDVKINDYASLAPSVGIGGNSIVGEGSIIGIGSSIIQSKSIGDWSILGAGSVVVRDVPAGVTVAGVPARDLKNSGGER